MASCLLAAAAPHGSTASPDLGKGEDAVLLEESLEIDIASATSARVRYLNRTQVLTLRGVDRYDGAAISYAPGVTIHDLRGTVISPTGKRLEVKKQQIADGAAFASFELYSDSMMRVVTFPGVVPGAVLEYSYEKEVRNLFYLPGDFDLQESIPVRLKTLTVRTPASFPIRIRVHGSEPEHSREEKDGTVIQSWTVRDVPPMRSEKQMPPMEDVTPRISISLKEILWGDRTLDASNWAGVARFQWELLKDRQAASPEVAEMAKTLTASLPEPDDKVRTLFEFAQGKINYVAVELGIGGWQPHASGDVLKHRYGDCKDKATLLIAMLHSVGLRGYHVLIRTRDEGSIDRDEPGLTFNHAIVAVPAADGYLFLDPTSSRTPYGDLPWVDQGVPVLVVKDDGQSDFVETPLFPPDRNRRNRVVTASVGTTGDLEGTYVIEAWGQRRVALDDLLEGSASERDDALEDLITWLCPGAVMKGHEIAPPAKPGEPIRVTIRFAVPRFVTRAGTAQIVSPHLVRVPGLTEMATYPTRRFPVFFAFLSNETSEVRLTLPAGRGLKKLPADRTLDGPGVASRTHYEAARDGDRNVLVVRRSVTVSQREISPTDYPKLRTFLAALGEEEAGAVTLVPAG